MSGKQTLELLVNGTATAVEVAPGETIAETLRERLNLTGTHIGCEQGICGACTVLLDGEPVRACLLLTLQCANRRIITVEGVGTRESLHPVQKALVEGQGMQCGFCTPGIVMSAVALYESEEAEPGELDDVLAGHVCRCTGYAAIRDALSELFPGSGKAEELKAES